MTGKIEFFRYWIKTGVLVILLGGCSSHSEKTLTLAMDWSVNTNHVGIITALKKGFYEEEGLQVRLVDFGKTGSTSLIANNQVDMALSSEGEITFSVDKGAPLLSVAALFSHNPSGFYSLEHSKIFSPADLQGKIYGGWGSSMEDIMIRALIRKGGVANPSFENRTLGSTNVLLALKNVDFLWGMQGWQGVQLELAHLPFHFLPVAKYIPMLDDYTPIVVVNTQSNFYKEHQDQLRKFLRATERGARWVKSHPEDGVDSLISYDETLSRDLLRRSLEILLPQMLTKKGEWGVQEFSRYQDYLHFVQKEGLTKSEIHAKDLFSNDFLNREIEEKR